MKLCLTLYKLCNSKIIDETPFISNIRKDFYKKILEMRYEKILKFSYEKLCK